MIFPKIHHLRPKTKNLYPLPLAVSHPGTRIQATSWPGEISRNSGSMCAQASIAIGQRVRKRQPDGGLIGVGTSPCKTTRFRFWFGSGMGIAESSAFVYGCNGLA